MVPINFLIIATLRIICVIKTTQTKDNFVEKIDLRQQEFKL